jgi:N-methylhydantoinase A
MLVGIDIGGTFTDFVILTRDEMRVHKRATTPGDQSRAIVDGLRELGVDAAAEVAHGTTIATNALLERRTARAALLTTAGFADVLIIGRQNRPHLYRFSQHRPAPLVPEEWRFEVTERLDAQGTVIQHLDESAVAALAEQLKAKGVESLAIVFLFSFLNPAHERRAADIVREAHPDVFLSLSSDILPEYREYERTVTTVVNAAVQPLVSRYLGRLATALEQRRLRVMQSSGGVIGLEQAAEQAARLVLSGPAGGVVGAFSLAQRVTGSGAPDLITLDMGGTSTDVALCPGAIPYTAESSVADLPLRLPAVDIHTVGAGGGSLAHVDPGGALHVGPQSAGADPGPVCYGRGGTAPTVTDANLILGRLDPAHFLGGESSIALDAAAARAALTELGAGLGCLTAETAALGVIQVVNATMERALRRVSVERGHDPRTFTLVPFGGAGPLHACDLADALDIRRVLIPPHPGVLSALGLLVADVVRDASHAILYSIDELIAAPTLLRETFDGLASEVAEVMKAEVLQDFAIEAALDLRYRGQSYELTVPLNTPITAESVSAARDAFHAAHARRYGYAIEDEPVTAVTLRVRGVGKGADAPLPRDPLSPADASAACVGEKSVWFTPEEPTPTRCYTRAALRPGHRFTGPAIVFQYDTTILLPPRWQARVDTWHTIWLER